MRAVTVRRLLPALLVAVSVVACSAQGGAPAASQAAATDPPATSAPASVAPSAQPGGGGSAPPATDEPASSDAAVVLDQAWATAGLTDVATGETFRIADLAGRPLIIETMAIWCSSCLAQQDVVYETLAGVEPGSVDYILIDVDPSETAEALAAYRERNGFTGRYVVASTELARALVADFGDQVLNPPSTPMVVVGADGTVTLTPFGKKSADDMRTLLSQHGA
jgi:thiol-disulfide isomerase/thioredoxin